MSVDGAKTSLISRLKNYPAKDPVQFAAALLAVLSCFLVHPSPEYIAYIDYRVLVLLFCLMSVVAGMRAIGVFDMLCRALLNRVTSVRSVMLLLTCLSFLLSMFLTNDVTLVTLVPFTMILFKQKESRDLVSTLIMETVAANLGSMLTPIGNPQNLYLFEAYHFEMTDFLLMMLPYTALSLVMILITVLWYSRGSAGGQLPEMASQNDDPTLQVSVPKFLFYLILFVLCVLSVARLLDYRILLLIIAAAIIPVDRKLFRQVDYSLLITFVFFFVFIGNMGNVPTVHHLLSEIIQGRELLTAVLASQAVSNVPAAMLLSGFTDQGRALVIGTDLGGLGTLIASMASLITYRYYAVMVDSKKGLYITRFSIVNVVLLMVLLVEARLLY